jgi:hypothetical protein
MQEVVGERRGTCVPLPLCGAAAQKAQGCKYFDETKHLNHVTDFNEIWY